MLVLDKEKKFYNIDDEKLNYILDSNLKSVLEFHNYSLKL